MIIDLGAPDLDDVVSEPGVALVNWRDPSDAQSLLFDRFFEAASDSHPDVRFATVDTRFNRELMSTWDVRHTPTLMAYRDGMLLFSRVGPLPPPALDALVEALWLLDMEQLRQTVNGQSPRLTLTFQPSNPGTIEVSLGHWPSGGAGTGTPRRGGRPS